jgi:DNA-directed RNA polymerase specialized sigma24 family protein
MRGGRDHACAEFDARFRPRLEAYARRVRIPRFEWDTCISEVLSDESFRFASGQRQLPASVSAYLIGAARNRFLRSRRAQECRDRNHAAASTERTGEWIVTTLCSENALRTSAGVDDQGPTSSEALRRLVADLCANLSDDERALLGWVSEGIPHRQIAKWLGMGYDACVKRAWRLARRLREQAAKRAALYDHEQRAEVERFLRRAAGPAARENVAARAS